MRFFQADAGAAAGGGGPADATPGQQAEAEAAKRNLTPPDFYKNLLVKLLGLDATADDATIQSAFDKASAAGAAATDSAEQVSNLNAQIGDLQTQLASANSAVTAMQAQLDKAKQDEVDGILEEYGELPDEAKATLRETLLSDPAKGQALLSVIPKKSTASANGAAAPSAENQQSEISNQQSEAAPPPPKHDPAKKSGALNEEDLAKRIRTRAIELQKTNKRLSFQSAFAQAEKELKAGNTK